MSVETRFYPRQTGFLRTITTTSAGGLDISVLQPQDATGGSYTRVSTTTPGYRSLSEKGKKDLPMNPFSFESIKRAGFSGHVTQKATNLTNGTWTQYDTRGLYLENGTVLPSMLKSASIITRLKLQASRKFLDNLKNQDVNAPVAIAEGGKTIKMLSEQLTQLARSALALRRGNFSGAARALGVSPRGGSRKQSNSQSLAQNWLELKYGWQPLVNDIYGAAQYLAKLRNGSINRVRLSSSSTHTEHSKNSDLGSTGVYNYVRTALYVVRYIVYFSEPPSVIPGTALGLSNPAAVVWELVPFSFVADWVFPLGSFLNNLDAVNGRVFLKGCETVFYKGTNRAIVHGKPAETFGNTRWEYNVSEEYLREEVSCTRNPLTGFPANHFPILQNPLSIGHLATALALVAQVFSGAPVKHLRI